MQYMSVKEAAAQWGVTIQMVRRYCQKGMIPQVIQENGGWRIPEGTQTGTTFTLNGKGIPAVNNPRRRGDQRFTVIVETPTKLTKKQKELLRQLDGLTDKNETPKIKKFFENLKDFFD